jgi:hypothetical protein
MSCEDIKHTLFTCNGAKEVWTKMGSGNLVDEACALDRSGSVVLEYLIRGKFRNIQERSYADLKELIITTEWYIWWMRPQKVNGKTMRNSYIRWL